MYTIEALKPGMRRYTTRPYKKKTDKAKPAQPTEKEVNGK